MRSLILQTTSRFLLGLLAVMSVFMLLRGHSAPGGGFVGGLLLASGVAVVAISHGPSAARQATPIDPLTLVALGLLIVSGAAAAGLVAGESLFDPLWVGELPGVGHIGTVPLFDVGVYCVVAGSALVAMLGLAEGVS